MTDAAAFDAIEDAFFGWCDTVADKDFTAQSAFIAGWKASRIAERQRLRDGALPTREYVAATRKAAFYTIPADLLDGDTP